MEVSNNDKNILISVISPVYKAEQIVPELVKRIIAGVSVFTDNYEIILIEDCGPDNSWQKIQDECHKNAKVKGIRFSRNFGQHYAITAGLEHAKGDYVVVMDCDLQDNPRYIKDMYDIAVGGADIVFTYKQKRAHSFLKNITARLFYRVYNYLLDNKENKLDENTGSYSLISRKVVNAALSFKEVNRDYLLILQMLGFSKAYMPIQHEKRFEGKSSYNYSKLIKAALDSIASHSDKLLRLSISIGFFIFSVSILWAMYAIYMYFTANVTAGYSSIFIFELLGTGLILMSLGITGIYIGKIFEQVKQRPLYIIDKTVNI
jgi:dolichol-phosphate mannosyltransferase